MSLRQAAAWAGLHGVAQLSDPALKPRLDKAAGFLSAQITRLLVDRAASEGLRPHTAPTALPGWRSAGRLHRTDAPCGMTLLDREGRRFDPTGQLATLPTDEAPHEVVVQAQVRGQHKTLPPRLVILRKCPTATLATQRKVRRAAQRRQQAVQPKALAAAEFLILATSLPAERYPADQIVAAYRLRWQIELAFKRLKSLPHIDALPTHTEAASRSWLCAHLILALLSGELSRDFLESFP